MGMFTNEQAVTRAFFFFFFSLGISVTLHGFGTDRILGVVILDSQLRLQSMSFVRSS